MENIVSLCSHCHSLLHYGILGDIDIGVHDIYAEIKKMIVNAYRVLLTRAQKKTIIYVKDKSTREYLKKMLCGSAEEYFMST